MAEIYQPRRKIIDGHVHLIGDGSSGSGCWIQLSRKRLAHARYMLHHLGISQTALFRNLDEEYLNCLTENVQESSLDAVVLLANDQVYDDNGQMVPNFSNFYVPNDYLLEVCNSHDEFLAGVSIHPARHDALAELERCIEKGAVLMKCLPCCQNINCNNPRYKPFWQAMAATKLPLLAHTGGELSVPVYNAEYASPEILRLPLECGVTVIAAHCATNSMFDPNYFSLFKSMLDEYPHLYGDTGALNSPLRSKHLKACLEISSRLVHGSDAPIPISAFWPLMRGLISFKQYRQISKIKNVLERDYQLKLAMGFSEEYFTRLTTLLL